MKNAAFSIRATSLAVASFALLSAASVRAEKYECSMMNGTNCRVAVSDGYNNRNDGSALTGSVTSTLLVVPGACPRQDRIVDVNLQLHVLHPYIGDLEVLLTHPDGTVVSALYRPGITRIDGNCPNDDVDITLDDDDGVEAPDACAATIPALQGPVVPFNPLSTFDGKVRNGIWTLTLRDYLAGNEGLLLGWTLDLPCVPELPNVTVDTTDAVVSERGPDEQATVTVTRTGMTTAALEVQYVVTGSASLADFEPLPGKVTIVAGSSSAEIVIKAVEDDVDELDETIIITLLEGTAYEIGGRGSAYVTLVERSGGAAGSGGGGSGGGGVAGGGQGGSSGTAGRSGAGGGAGSSGSAGEDQAERDGGVDGGTSDEEDDGCGCRIVGRRSRGMPVGVLALASVVCGIAWRRRKRSTVESVETISGASRFDRNERLSGSPIVSSLARR